MSEIETRYLGLAELKEEGKPFRPFGEDGSGRKYDPASDHVTLSTGTSIYALGLALAINADLCAFGAEGDDDEKLTPAERHEMADLAISWWRKYKEANAL